MASVPRVFARFQCTPGIGKASTVSEMKSKRCGCCPDILVHPVNDRFGKTFGKQNPLERSFRVYLKAYPFIADWEFFFQLIDKTFADVTERSNKIGEYAYFHFNSLPVVNSVYVRSHLRFLFENGQGESYPI
jgi:hypothetical protein